MRRQKLFNIFVFTLLTTQISICAYAFQLSGSEVLEKHKGPKNTTIYIFEEAHADYSIQKNLAESLRDIAEREKLRWIFVEGGWGDVSLTDLREKGSPEAREKAAEDFLKAGRISGEEYLDVVSELPLVLWGVEGADLYRQEMQAFMELDRLKPAAAEFFKSLEKALFLSWQNLKPEAHMALTRHQSFSRGETSWIDYAAFLFEKNPAGINRQKWLRRWFEIAGKSGMDLEKADLEKKELVRRLSFRLSKIELDSLQAVRDSRDLKQELDILRRLVRAYHADAALSQTLEIPNLLKMGAALEVLQKASAETLFAELDAAEQSYFQRLFQSPAERAAWQEARELELLRKWASLELARADWQKVKAVDWNGWFQTRSELLAKDPLLDEFFKKDWPKLFGAAQSFYRTAVTREAVMLRNLLFQMKRQNLEQAALITGGFHAAYFFQKLKALGYSVWRIRPQVEGSLEGHQTHYAQVMKEKWQGVHAQSGELKTPLARVA